MNIIPECRLHFTSPLAEWREYFRKLTNAELSDRAAKLRAYRLKCSTIELNTINQLVCLTDAEKAARYESLRLELEIQRCELGKAKTMSRLEGMERMATFVAKQFDQ